MNKIRLRKFLTIFILLFGVISFALPTIVHAQSESADYAIVLDASNPQDDESGIQRLKVDVKSGKYINSTFDVVFKKPTEYIKRDIVKGDIVLVKFNKNLVDEKIQSVEVVDFYRIPNIFWAPLLFMLILLIAVVVKHKRKVYIFLTVTLSVAISTYITIFFNINPILPIILSFSLLYAGALFIIYRKFTIAVVGLLLPMLLGTGAVLLSFLVLQLTSVQLSYLSIISSFYNLPQTDYTDAFYFAVLISSLVGATYVSYYQILESIKIKISNITVSKKELTINSFRHVIRTFDTTIFPSFGFLSAILLSVIVYLQKAGGLSFALNNDYFVALSILCSISLLVWVISVPICALLCGIILGRLEQHKIVTDKTISILD